MQAYMRAHGYTPGPTLRPRSIGAVSGAIAEIPAALVLWRTGAITSIARSLALNEATTLGLHWMLAIAGGLLYGQIFMRAANDRHGGWLFGISFGFLAWLIGPLTILQWALGGPVAVGTAAMGLFGA